MLEQFLKEEICNYINNVENELYCNLSDEETNEIAENIWSKVANDNELNNEFNITMEWYINKYINRKE